MRIFICPSSKKRERREVIWCLHQRQCGRQQVCLSYFAKLPARLAVGRNPMTIVPFGRSGIAARQNGRPFQKFVADVRSHVNKGVH